MSELTTIKTFAIDAPLQIAAVAAIQDYIFIAGYADQGSWSTTQWVIQKYRSDGTLIEEAKGEKGWSWSFINDITFLDGKVIALSQSSEHTLRILEFQNLDNSLYSVANGYVIQEVAGKLDDYDSKSEIRLNNYGDPIYASGNGAIAQNPRTDSYWSGGRTTRENLTIKESSGATKTIPFFTKDDEYWSFAQIMAIEPLSSTELTLVSGFTDGGTGFSKIAGFDDSGNRKWSITLPGRGGHVAVNKEETHAAITVERQGIYIIKIDGESTGVIDKISAPNTSWSADITFVGNELIAVTNKGQGGDDFFLYNIYENQAPISIQPLQIELEENAPVGSIVTTLNTSDPNSQDVHTYALVNGDGDTGNALFSIQGDELRVKMAADY